MNLENLNSEWKRIKEIAYDRCSFIISDLVISSEGKEYKACTFSLNGQNVIGRNAKITPKKKGQFVTFWRRNKKGITEPYAEIDEISFLLVNVRSGNRIGQFVLPKSVLIKKGIMSSAHKDGKRGFRVYPSWDTPDSKQAKHTQDWQTKYFIEFVDEMDLELFRELYQNQ